MVTTDPKQEAATLLALLFVVHLWQWMASIYRHPHQGPLGSLGLWYYTRSANGSTSPLRHTIGAGGAAQW